jgi:chorismate--pyruvate lyase
MSQVAWQNINMTLPDAGEIPPSRWSWVRDPGSLTQRLRTWAPHQIQFHVLTSNLGEVTTEERLALHLTDENPHWVREIEWRYQNELWIVARTIIPHTLQTHSDLYLALLNAQTSSIGSILLSSGGFLRGPIELAKLPPSHFYYSIVKGKIPQLNAKYLWTRRSIFSRGEERILVSEIFLPAFFNYAS